MIHNLGPDDISALLSPCSICPHVIHCPFDAKRAVDPTFMYSGALQLTPESGQRTRSASLETPVVPSIAPTCNSGSC